MNPTKTVYDDQETELLEKVLYNHNTRALNKLQFQYVQQFTAT